MPIFNKSTLTKDNNKAIYRWKPVLNEKLVSEDCAEKYAIEKMESAINGIILHPKYSNQWRPNPYNTRHLIKQLSDAIKRQMTKSPLSKPDSGLFYK